MRLYLLLLSVSMFCPLSPPGLTFPDFTAGQPIRGTDPMIGFANKIGSGLAIQHFSLQLTKKECWIARPEHST
jgi:hypothetical protein